MNTRICAMALWRQVGSEGLGRPGLGGLVGGPIGGGGDLTPGGGLGLGLHVGRCWVWPGYDGGCGGSVCLVGSSSLGWRWLRFLVYHVWMVAGSFGVSGVRVPTTRTITLGPGVLQIKAASDELARHGSIVGRPPMAGGPRPIEPVPGHFSFHLQQRPIFLKSCPGLMPTTI